MAEQQLVKSIYTSSDVTSLGEFTTSDTLPVANLPIITAAKGGTGVANNAASTVTISGNYATTLAVSNTTSITLPVSGTLAILGANVYTGQQTFLETKDTIYGITDGAAFEIDPVNGNMQTITLGADRTPAATNFEAGQAVLLGIDDGTARTITWTSVAVTWIKNGGTATAPTLATTGYTWIVLWKVATTIYGALVGSP